MFKESFLPEKIPWNNAVLFSLQFVVEKTKQSGSTVKYILGHTLQIFKRRLRLSLKINLIK